MTRIRALLAVLATVLLAGVSLHTGAQAAAPPGAPTPCAAAPVAGTADDYRVTWTRPADDGGSPIWRYVVKVKGQSKPVVQLSAANRKTENPTRSHIWTGPVAGRSPLTFQVRAVNGAGFGAWCEAAASQGSTTVPAPEPSPTPSPTAGPTASPTPTPSPTSSPSETTSPSPTTQPAPTTDPAGRPFLPYSADSFFKSTLHGAPVDATLTSQFRSFMDTHPEQTTAYPLIRGTGGNAWGMVYDMGDCTDPLWRLQPAKAPGTSANPQQWQSLTTNGGTGFHAPAGFSDRYTGTNDSPFVVIDRCTGITVWAANATKTGTDTVSVSAFGAFEHDSNGLHKANPRSDSSRNERGRGVIPDSMMIRKDLMDHAKTHRTDLGHVLEIFFVETDSAAGVVHPMVRQESEKYGFGAEGTRIAVDPALDLTARRCSPEALVIARTLQNYGGYLGDNSGSQTTIKAEQESADHPVWNGTLVADELAGCITWDDFVVIKPGWQ